MYEGDLKNWWAKVRTPILCITFNHSDPDSYVMGKEQRMKKALTQDIMCLWKCQWMVMVIFLWKLKILPCKADSNSEKSSSSVQLVLETIKPGRSFLHAASPPGSNSVNIVLTELSLVPNKGNWFASDENNWWLSSTEMGWNTSGGRS